VVRPRLFSELPARCDKRPSIFIRDISIFSSERMLRKYYDHKGSVEKENLVVIFKGLGAKTK
jgi:hypothetical protein